MSRDLPGVDPTTLNGLLLYYRLMTKWSGLGDSTELSRVGLSQGALPFFYPQPSMAPTDYRDLGTRPSLSHL
jgi:hypothetical protein